MFYQANLERRKSVIIFDEVQFCPCARQVIKHLVADHRYDYIETGLFVTLMFFDSDFVENDIYAKLLSGRARVNLGYLYENITAQVLVAQGYHLYYYTLPKEQSRRRYEIDFLLPERSKIIPIEVKSSGYRTHASLVAFAQKFSARIARRGQILYNMGVGGIYPHVIWSNILTRSEADEYVITPQICQTHGGGCGGGCGARRCGTGSRA